SSMFEDGNYIGRPRALPHFITGLGIHKAEFRRMVRALNYGLAPQHQLPYQLLYDDTAERRKKQPHPADMRSPEQIKADRNHRRNQHRRYKRKASRKPTRPNNSAE
ncbi:MAG: hypothetical protein J6Y87_04095, partial [Muribaculaceae bacterium]|nr:hypothetical protein [Muribaculaceae bacterium]